VIEVQEVSTQEWTVSQLERKAKVLAGESVLASMRTDHALIAWAESHDLMVRIDRSGIWGNPYEVDADGPGRKSLRGTKNILPTSVRSISGSRS
jgi:hypothetical protein